MNAIINIKNVKENFRFGKTNKLLKNYLINGRNFKNGNIKNLEKKKNMKIKRKFLQIKK